MFRSLPQICASIELMIYNCCKSSWTIFANFREKLRLFREPELRPPRSTGGGRSQNRQFLARTNFRSGTRHSGCPNRWHSVGEGSRRTVFCPRFGWLIRSRSPAFRTVFRLLSYARKQCPSNVEQAAFLAVSRQLSRLDMATFFGASVTCGLSEFGGLVAVPAPPENTFATSGRNAHDKIR
jgi:hypothetical protein